MSRKEYMRDYYRKNRTAALEKQKWYYEQWKEAHPGESYYGTEYKMYYGARDRCKKSGVEFAITVADIVVPKLCPVLGVEMVKGGRYAPSLDRINPKLGYLPENIWVISKLANRMKNDANQDELERFANWVNQSQH